jgi:hypothetical protein
METFAFLVYQNKINNKKLNNMSVKNFNKFMKDRSLLSESQDEMETGYFPKPDDWPREMSKPANIYGVMDEPEEVTLDSLNSKIAELESKIEQLSLKLEQLESNGNEDY